MKSERHSTAITFHIPKTHTAWVRLGNTPEMSCSQEGNMTAKNETTDYVHSVAALVGGWNLEQWLLRFLAMHPNRKKRLGNVHSTTGENLPQDIRT